MDQKIELIFQKYRISQKDRYEFLQIYMLLSPEKKVSMLENFDSIYQEIEWLKQELAVEQEFLFGKTLESIEQQVYEMKKQALAWKTWNEVQELKHTLVSLR